MDEQKDKDKLQDKKEFRITISIIVGAIFLFLCLAMVNSQKASEADNTVGHLNTANAIKILKKAGYEGAANDIKENKNNSDYYDLKRTGKTTIINIAPNDGEKYECITFVPKKNHKVNITVATNHSGDGSSYTLAEYDKLILYEAAANTGNYGAYAQRIYCNAIVHDDTYNKKYTYFHDYDWITSLFSGNKKSTTKVKNNRINGSQAGSSDENDTDNTSLKSYKKESKSNIIDRKDNNSDSNSKNTVSAIQSKNNLNKSDKTSTNNKENKSYVSKTDNDSDSSDNNLDSNSKNSNVVSPISLDNVESLYTQKSGYELMNAKVISQNVNSTVVQGQISSSQTATVTVSRKGNNGDVNIHEDIKSSDSSDGNSSNDYSASVAY